MTKAAKTVFVDAIQRAALEDVRLSKKTAESIWDEVQKTIVSELLEKRKVSIDGLGKLVPTIREAHSARNPQTGETIQVKEKRVVKVKPGKAWEEA